MSPLVACAAAAVAARIRRLLSLSNTLSRIELPLHCFLPGFPIATLLLLETETIPRPENTVERSAINGGV